MAKTIISLLKQTAEKYPAAKFLSEKNDNGWQATTFTQADKLSDFFAVALLQNGFSENDKIAILSEGRTKWVIAELGILKIKAISVPLSVKLTSEEILFRLNHSEAKAIVISHNNIEKILPVLDKINCKKFKIIYLDNDTGFLKILEEKHNISFDGKLIFYDDILNSAKDNFEKNKDKLQKIVSKIKEDDIVNISYTSGTTGNPKGIMLSHLNYYSNAEGSAQMFDLPPESRLFMILPIDHSFAHTAGIFVAMLIPFTIYFLDTRGGSLAALKNIPVNIKETKPNVMFTVPALSGSFMKNIIASVEKQGKFVTWLFNKGLNAGKKIYGNGFDKTNNAKASDKMFHKLADKLIFSKIRENFGGELMFCVGGGALLDINQQEFFYAIGMPIYQGYGLTEASPVISANTAKEHKLGTSGKILPNIECKIIENGKELAQGQKGEILVKGDSVMKGYFKNPEATAKVLKDGGLYTGDLGYFDKDGFLVVTGRAKALLISEDGEKYSPEEIEETLAGIPFIKFAMLYNDHSKYTTAIIDLDENYTKTYIKNHKIASPEKLAEIINSEIQTKLKEGETTGRFQKKWLPSVYIFAPEHFSEENKMVNSTMKMVRYKVTEYYKDLIAQMYQPNAKNNTFNINVLKKLFEQ